MLIKCKQRHLRETTVQNIVAGAITPGCRRLSHRIQTHMHFKHSRSQSPHLKRMKQRMSGASFMMFHNFDSSPAMSPTMLPLKRF